MTDLELTKACAEKMGLPYRIWCEGQDHAAVLIDDSVTYRPLSDDAQAMALVKRFKLDINQAHLAADAPWWRINYGRVVGVSDRDLNRAIVECVAKLPKPE